MTERLLTTLFSKFLKEHPLDHSATFEIKMCKGKSFVFSSVRDHQVKGLLDSLNGLGHKISDSPIYKGSRSRFTFKKPFDYLYIKAKRAYVVPIFYSARHYKVAYLIPIQEFVELAKKGKSIKKDDIQADHYYL